MGQEGEPVTSSHRADVVVAGENQQQNLPCGMVIREVSQALLPGEQCCCS